MRHVCENMCTAFFVCVFTCVALTPSVSRCCAGCADSQAVGRPSDGPPLLIDRGITETDEERTAAAAAAASLSPLLTDPPTDSPTDRSGEKWDLGSQVPSRQIWAREELERLSNMWKSARAPFDFCRPDAARSSRQIPSDFNSLRTERR